jgi:glycine/D-amino acid oxidase-like deaminating enzyme
MTASLWWDTLPEALLAPVGSPLPGDREADVAIVGAGYTGLWTAYYLQRADPGLRIAIIEAEVAGFGASGRNGGWASALFPASLAALARRRSRSQAQQMKRAMFGAVREIGRAAMDEGWDIDWAHGGTVGLARTALQWERAKKEIADLQEWGFGPEDYRLLNAREAEERVDATDIHGATFTPHCAAIHPAKLVRHLAQTVARNGAQVFESTPVTRIDPSVVHTERGRVHAPIIVRATEGYTPTIKGMRRTLAPVYSLMLATEPLPHETLESIGLEDRPTFSDGRHLIIYGQRTADGRIAFGGRGAPYYFGSRIDPQFDHHPAVHQDLWRVLCELFPQLQAARVTHTWGGPLGIARDWWASCGLDRRTGLAWAGGYVGDGVGTSNLAGRTLRDLILDEPSDLTTLPWVNHHSRKWEPEPLRWMGTNIGLRVMSSADETEQRTGRESRSAKLFARKIGH